MITPLTKRIFIAGAGGIGRALGLMLRNEPSLSVEVTLGDLDPRSAEQGAAFASYGGTGAPARAFTMPKEGSTDELDRLLAGMDAIVDCLPGSQAPRMARLARTHTAHYLNLTEYVKETEEVLEIAQGADTCFALQCGLAPGFINILAHDLFQQSCELWETDRVDRIRMRVGALATCASAPHYYGWTWSPVGVATEYVKPAYAVRDGNRVELPSLSERETLLIEGQPFEEALTSGGAADLPQALAGRVRDLDYKTLRYPGHYEWVEGLLAKVPKGADRAALLQQQMESVIPHCEDDLVVIYADVEGKDRHGRLRLSREALFCPQIEIAGQRLRAIQSTTAAGVAEVLNLIFERGFTGPLLQSQIPASEYLDGPFARLAYGPGWDDLGEDELE